MRNEYRVRNDGCAYKPYWVDIRYWWFPVAWLGLRYFETPEKAEAWARLHADPVVKALGRLP